MSNDSEGLELERDLAYLGLLDKAQEIYAELGGQAVLSYVKSSYRLLSKVYHPDLNPGSNRKATIAQQALNRVNHTISRISDEELLDVIRRGIIGDSSGRRKILVVEDEPAMQTVIQQILTMEGYDSRFAEDGIKGYKAFQRFKPDLLLCDVVIPGMNGLELVGKIRKIYPKIKVIYISGFFDIEPLKGQIHADVTRYGYRTLAKPFKISEMLTLIEDYLQNDHGQISGVDTVA